MAKILILLTALVLLSACGSGGDSSNTTSAQGSPSEPDNNSNPGNTSSADSVTYSLRFSTIWSVETFATMFPNNRHFSPLVGMAHNGQSALWVDAGLATVGMESMAETGDVSLLNAEINQFIGQGFAQFLINGQGIPRSQDSTEVEFDVSYEFPLVRIVSMVAPSPDWFVGVRGFDLRDANGNWIQQVAISLPVYDAGTDDGLSFESEDDNSDPKQPILLLTTDASDSDFLDGLHRDSGIAVATLVFTLQ